jgi:hypothetical protein
MTSRRPAVADLAEQQRRTCPLRVRWAKHCLAEHRISQSSAADCASHLAGDDRGGLADTVAMAEYPVSDGHYWIEVRPAGRREHEDQHGQAHRGYQ